MAISQMVGLVQEAFRGRKEGPVDQEQRFDNDITADQHLLIYGTCLLRDIRCQDSGFDLHQQLSDICMYQPS